MSTADRADLGFVFERDKSVRTHYVLQRLLYRKWLERACHAALPGNGRTIEMTPADTVEHLTSWIKNYDHALKRRMTKPTEDSLAMNHERVCRLFAMNVVAAEPVNPEGKRP